MLTSLASTSLWSLCLPIDITLTSPNVKAETSPLLLCVILGLTPEEVFNTLGVNTALEGLSKVFSSTPVSKLLGTLFILSPIKVNQVLLLVVGKSFISGGA